MLGPPGATKSFPSAWPPCSSTGNAEAVEMRRGTSDVLVDVSGGRTGRLYGCARLDNVDRPDIPLPPNIPPKFVEAVFSNIRLATDGGRDVDGDSKGEAGDDVLLETFPLSLPKPPPVPLSCGADGESQKNEPKSGDADGCEPSVARRREDGESNDNEWVIPKAPLMSAAGCL